MSKSSISPSDLKRLHDEQEEANRLYNDALTALDSALHRLHDMPDAPPGHDEQQIRELNERWNLLDLTPNTEGWRGKLRGLVWSTLAPLFERQHAFNSALVDHINRNAKMNRDVSRAVTEVIELLRQGQDNLVEFEHKLIQFAQQITGYVETKDRDAVGALQAGVIGSLEGLSDELQKRWESMVARERRYQASVDEVRSTTAVWHEVTASLKRELDGLRARNSNDTKKDSEASVIPPTSAYDGYKYVAFEDNFRGSQAEIRSRVAGYLPYFEGATNVLDVGCGRGEFLDLLRERGVTASGIELNHDMVEVCRTRNLLVSEGDAVSYLGTLPDDSLGGLFAAQVVEHLEPEYLLKFLGTAFLKLRPGAKLILETINVASWSAFFQSYVRDITHVRPIHPDTLKYLVTASGFQKAEVIYQSPYPEENQLKMLELPTPKQTAATPAIDTELTSFVSVVNQNIETLNRLLFSDQDYAVIAERK